MSLRDRISQASQALFGREKRGMELPFEQSYSVMGRPPLFNAPASLDSYGDNTWLAGAVDKIAREIARTKFFLRTENPDGEIKLIKSHQALETLNRPQPTKKGKAILTGFNMRYVTGLQPR